MGMGLRDVTTMYKIDKQQGYIVQHRELQPLSCNNFFLMSLLEYNCFTMLCQFLLYNKVNQLYVYMYCYIPSLLSLPPTLPIPLLQVITKHQADLPVLCSSFPLAIHFTSGSIYIYQCYSLTSFQLPLPHRVLKSILYICIFIPSLPLGSSVPFFFRFHICVLAYGICFSLSDLLQIGRAHV